MARTGRVLALIPARAGSKGIPDKNLTQLGGKSLIAYTIEAARGSRLIDRVIVTTDSKEIAARARRAGAEVPFLRPRALATDRSPVIDAARHALDWLSSRGGWEPEIVALLQPTSPLRSSARIDEAIRLLRRGRADTVVGVCRPAVHPWKCVLFSGGRMSYAVPRPKHPVARQSYPEVHAINGALYVTRAENILAGRVYGPRVLPLVMDAWESVDIDEPADLALAEHYLKESRRR
jgi:CMP-N-acetylneuraminic acid synthetase